jgi:hypothetical protein
MAKQNVIDVTKEIYKLLEPLSPEDRSRVISAALTLLGQEQITSKVGGGREEGDGGKSKPSTSQSYFAQKDPHKKVEFLAVAARFREQNKNEHEHKKEDFESVIKDARRNFDGHNFSTDISNAKRKGLFIKGKENKLSFYGQQYVDTLPDREALKKLRPPTKRGKKKAKAKAKKA